MSAVVPPPPGTPPTLSPKSQAPGTGCNNSRGTCSHCDLGASWKTPLLQSVYTGLDNTTATVVTRHRTRQHYCRPTQHETALLLQSDGTELDGRVRGLAVSTPNASCDKKKKANTVCHFSCQIRAHFGRATVNFPPIISYAFPTVPLYRLTLSAGKSGQ